MTIEMLRTEQKKPRESKATVAAPPAPPKSPKTEPSPRPERAGRSRSVAAQRAYARRAHREGRRVEPVDEPADRSAGRASFVVLIIGVLAIGIAATLWLSTQAIADSYRLEDAKQNADRLAEQAAELQREVTKAESASALAERARQMGMVPAGDSARLIVKEDGTVVVVGEPKPAQPPAPPAAPGEQQQPPPQQQAGTAPGAG